MKVILRTNDGKHIEFKSNTLSIVNNRLRCDYLSGNDNCSPYLTNKVPQQIVIPQNNISQLLIQ